MVLCETVLQTRAAAFSAASVFSRELRPRTLGAFVVVFFKQTEAQKQESVHLLCTF